MTKTAVVIGVGPIEGLGAYLSTHPPVGDRIAKLRHRLAVAETS